MGNQSRKIRVSEGGGEAGALQGSASGEVSRQAQLEIFGIR